LAGRLAEVAMCPVSLAGGGGRAADSMAIAWLTPFAKWLPSMAKMRVFLGD
jgi:hypothetical protein